MNSIAPGMRRLFLCGLLLSVCLSFVSEKLAATEFVNTAPGPKNTQIDVGYDLAGMPANIYIWKNEFGGATDPACGTSIGCINMDSQNILLCNNANSVYGHCQSSPYWIVGDTGNDTITLEFRHSSGRKVDLLLTSRKWGNYASWNAAAMLRKTNGFNVFIPAQELKKLPLTGVWKASLKMRVKAWGGPCSGYEDTHTGCTWNPILRADWNADITLRITDTGTQQIYFPAYPTSTPTVNLKINAHPGKDAEASGRNGLDMCLYDGSDSTRNQVSLIFSDEGASAEGRPTGQFSVYRVGGVKTQPANRIDYRVSVLNPTTGAVQNITNGKEIIWMNTNRRNIQRQVVLPGVPGSTWCVPAPITLITPQFKMTDKSSGKYRGTLRIIYTPTTQSSSER